MPHFLIITLVFISVSDLPSCITKLPSFTVSKVPVVLKLMSKPHSFLKLAKIETSIFLVPKIPVLGYIESG